MDHYIDRYWNELPEVLSYLCRSATGDPKLWWMDYFKQNYATPPLQRALVIACGNGWVERSLYDRRVALHFDAYDPDPSYLEQAEALRGDRPIRYFQADFTSFSAEHPYDLVVNVAALHHARRLYETVERVACSMTEAGILVNWDYVGPSRNQYSPKHLGIMKAANRSLPTHLRSPHPLRPALRTIISGDPTEAAHSSEIRKAVGLYFDILEWNDLGGGVAYQILWNNVAGFQDGDPTAKSSLERLLATDDELTRNGVVPSLFAFFVARRQGRPRARLTKAYHRYMKEPLREIASRFLMRDAYLRDYLHRCGAL
jgi:SAM-dependent methyltransferase